MEVSFIGGGNRSTWRKPHVTDKLDHIIVFLLLGSYRINRYRVFHYKLLFVFPPFSFDYSIVCHFSIDGFSFGLVLGIWYLAPLSTILRLYRGGQFYWWRKPKYLEKSTDLP